jgi:hypothetical protein
MMDIHFPIAGLLLLFGAIAFLKFFDFLAARSVKRLLEKAGTNGDGSDNPALPV